MYVEIKDIKISRLHSGTKQKISSSNNTAEENGYRNKSRDQLAIKVHQNKGKTEYP